jgi:hypothetical protein
LTQQTLLRFMSPPNCRGGDGCSDNNSSHIEQLNADSPRNTSFLYKSSCASSLEVHHENLLSEDECSSPRISETCDEPFLLDTSFEGNHMLDTYIVGRKFCDNVALEQGTEVTLSRDTQNVKDNNAIKV